ERFQRRLVAEVRAHALRPPTIRNRAVGEEHEGGAQRRACCRGRALKRFDRGQEFVARKRRERRQRDACAESAEEVAAAHGREVFFQIGVGGGRHGAGRSGLSGCGVARGGGGKQSNLGGRQAALLEGRRCDDAGNQRRGPAVGGLQLLDEVVDGFRIIILDTPAQRIREQLFRQAV